MSCMKMKKRLWSLSSGNKGFVFSFDIMMAVLIVMLILAAATFYATKATEDSLSNLQMTRTGSDILAVMDYDGVLKTLSTSSIEESLNELLPTNYNMRIEIKGKTFGPVIVETTSETPQDRFVGSGKRMFNVNADFYIARYWIWLK